jgi:hypothetical protein
MQLAFNRLTYLLFNVHTLCIRQGFLPCISLPCSPCFLFSYINFDCQGRALPVHFILDWQNFIAIILLGLHSLEFFSYSKRNSALFSFLLNSSRIIYNPFILQKLFLQEILTLHQLIHYCLYLLLHLFLLLFRYLLLSLHFEILLLH